MRNGLSESLLAICLAMTAGLSAGQGPDSAQLARFKKKIQRDIAGTNNYSCLETIVRERRAPPTYEFKPVDTVRLEVSMVAGKELFAKPGQRFEDRDVTSLLNGGAIGSGMFSMLVHHLFVSGRGTLRYAREENLDGHRTVRYDFRLTRQESDFRLQVANMSEMAAAKGSLWFDPVSLDLIRLEIHGQNIPDYLHIDKAVVRIDYARARIGDSDALLPKRSELTMNFVNGITYRDAIGFSQCHEYRAESTIAFGKGENASTQGALPPKQTQDSPQPIPPQASVPAASTASSPGVDGAVVQAPVSSAQSPAPTFIPQPPPALATIAVPEPPAKAETVPRDDPVSFKSQVNLVMVPVVVRDRKGNAIGGLRKQDFHLFDRNRRQEITSFRVQQAAALTGAPAQTLAGSAGLTAEKQSPKAPEGFPPEHFVAFVFDDVHLRFEDVVYVRDATRRYIAGSLAPGDRTAVVTTSGHAMLDFTNDRAKLDAELQKLQPRAIARGGGAKRCPDISFYEADRLDRESNPNGGPLGRRHLRGAGLLSQFSAARRSANRDSGGA